MLIGYVRVSTDNLSDCILSEKILIYKKMY